VFFLAEVAYDRYEACGNVQLRVTIRKRSAHRLILLKYIYIYRCPAEVAYDKYEACGNVQLRVTIRKDSAHRLIF